MSLYVSKYVKIYICCSKFFFVRFVHRFHQFFSKIIDCRHKSPHIRLLIFVAKSVDFRYHVCFRKIIIQTIIFISFEEFCDIEWIEQRRLIIVRINHRFRRSINCEACFIRYHWFVFHYFVQNFIHLRIIREKNENGFFNRRFLIFVRNEIRWWCSKKTKTKMS